MERLAPVLAESVTHNDLVLLAEKWLKRQGCGVVFRDAFRAITEYGEQPDAIGWRTGASILVECKASRNDFLADRNKQFRVDSYKGVGDWRFYLCPPGLILPSELPEKWGLLYTTGKRIIPVCGVPSNIDWFKRPFRGNKECENQMLYSALRRFEVRGMLGTIYEPLIGY